MYRSGIIGTGSYLPEKRETIEDFLKKGAAREIIEKWGVFEHRVMGEGETVTDMEAKAAKVAIERAGLKPADIELIIGITALSEEVNPQNVCLTQYKIGAVNAASFQLDLSCCGAIPAMAVANNFIALGQYKYILLVASCNLTQVSDDTDPASFVVLGDGASAIIMSPAEDDRGVISFDLATNGRFFGNCGIKVKRPKYFGGRSSYINPPSERLLFFIDYDEKNPSSALNRYLIKSVPESVKRALKKANLRADDIDWLIPHQNVTPLSGKWIELLGITKEKACLTNHKYGNMSAANIWVNLDEAVQEDKIKDGDIVAFAGQGSGFHVGSIVIRWGKL
ncbi:MAG: 3-oxoacyl-ACP synthase III family protein [Nitrospinae bacterium]|nr:3-oxoacyl-ACP synthase III family protein [Nitrospinota bacterium]MBI3813717.1 3-oxoacyl-ACP synthase III family protein [Nitrospinota bacterium]